MVTAPMSSHSRLTAAQISFWALVSATANEGVSREDLANKVNEAVTRGRTVVIGGDGQLDYSDQVRPEDTGQPADTTLPGHAQPPKETES